MFTGHRVWRIADWERGLLGAAAQHYTWDAPVLSVPTGQVAELPTGGGFHAFRTPELAVGYLGIIADYYRGVGANSWRAYGQFSLDYANNPHAWVVGRVDLYGTVIEYEEGFRASHAIVRELAIAPVWDDAFAGKLADRYQCPVGRWVEVGARAAGRKRWRW